MNPERQFPPIDQYLTEAAARLHRGEQMAHLSLSYREAIRNRSSDLPAASLGQGSNSLRERLFHIGRNRLQLPDTSDTLYAPFSNDRIKVTVPYERYERDGVAFDSTVLTVPAYSGAMNRLGDLYATCLAARTPATPMELPLDSSEISALVPGAIAVIDDRRQRLYYPDGQGGYTLQSPATTETFLTQEMEKIQESAQ